jgi:hypothetical protein
MTLQLLITAWLGNGRFDYDILMSSVLQTKQNRLTPEIEAIEPVDQ